MRATSERPSAAVARDPGARAPATLTIARVDPLDHGAAIKQLFLAHERPEFPDYFERAYPTAVANGGTSWVGWDEHGRLCAHVAQFPREFAVARRGVRGALLANLMVAKPYRTFWPALALLRRAVKDLRASGSVDFVYADPNEQAQPVLRAAGFHSAGALRRFVLPLTHRRRSVAQAIRLYHLLRRWGTTPLVAIERGVEEPAGVFPTADPGSLRPVRDPSLYPARLAGYPSASDRWYTFRPPGLRGVLVGEALVRGPDREGVTVVCVLHYEPVALLSSLLVALVRRLRDTGATRLEIWAMLESQVADAVQRAGFLPRPEHVSVLALPLTALGTEAMTVGCEWRLLPIDLDR